MLLLVCTAYASGMKHKLIDEQGAGLERGGWVGRAGYTSEQIIAVRGLGPVSRKSRNFTGHFRVSQFPLYLKNGKDLSHQTSQSFFFLLPLKHVKRLTFQNERLAVSQMAFRARKVFGTFEKQAPVSQKVSKTFAARKAIYEIVIRSARITSWAFNIF